MTEGSAPFSKEDMLRPPFSDCPYCGQPEFGTIVLPHGYSRHCRQCHQPNASSEDSTFVALPPIQKTVIYLDQCILSDMTLFGNPASTSTVRDKINEQIPMMTELLWRLIQLQVLVCPSSSAHWQESIASKELRDDLQRAYSLLSGGIRFKHSVKIARLQLRTAFEAWLNGVAPTYSFACAEVVEPQTRLPLPLAPRLDGWRPSYSFLVPLSAHEAPFRDWTAAIKSRGANGISHVFSRWQKEDRNYCDYVEEEGAAYGASLIEQVVCVLNGTSQGEALLDALHGPVATCCELFQVAVGRCASNEEAIDSVFRFLRSSELLRVPCVRLGAMMWARLAVGARKRKKPLSPGMGTDVEVISHFLPYCHAMFVDNECRAILESGDLRGEVRSYGTKIFSRTNIQTFVAYLEGLEASVSTEHAALVRSVYGEPLPFALRDSRLMTVRKSIDGSPTLDV